MKHKIQKHIWRFTFASPILFSIVIFVLGLITPGYDHLSLTISRLAITKYGWIQQFNFGQFGLSLLADAYIFTKILSQKNDQQVWVRTFLVCFILVLLVILFPADPINSYNNLWQMMTPHGVIHFSVLLIFLIIAVLNIHFLRLSLEHESEYIALAKFTARSGYIVCTLCFTWMLLFVSGLFWDVRGLFQKIIALFTIYWLLNMLWQVRGKYFSKIQ
jgi:hypothetical protein